MLRNSLTVLIKDLRLEFRTRYAMNAIALFAITTLVTVGYSIAPVRLDNLVLAPLLWIIIFFSAMSALSHVFVREEEQQTADTLRLLFKPEEVLLGKWMFNILLLFALNLLVVPLFFALMNATVQNMAILLSVLILGSLALATASTIIGAIISLAGSRGALFAVLSFPIALPVLISAIHSTRLALTGATFSDCMADLKVLFSFTVVLFTASWLLFDFVWKK